MEQRSERETRPRESGKREYEPPEIQSQEVFETTALACAKRPGQSGPCAIGSKRS
jgi:hypothetical protein